MATYNLTAGAVPVSQALSAGVTSITVQNNGSSFIAVVFGTAGVAALDTDLHILPASSAKLTVPIGATTVSIVSVERGPNCAVTVVEGSDTRALVVPVPRGPLGSAKPQTTGSLMVCGNVSQNGLAADFNWGYALTTPEHFDAVRIGIFNKSTSGGWAGIKAIFGVSDSMAIATDRPYRAGAIDNTVDGATSLWKTLLWGGATTAPALNLATVAADPAVTFSDWLPISSLNRVDVAGGNPIGILRIHTPAGAVTEIGSNNSSRNDRYEAANPGHIFRTYVLGPGDAVTTPSAWSSAQATEGVPLIPVIQFRYRNKVATIASFGDSTFEGFLATNRVGWQALAFGKTGQKISHCNFGWNGQNSAQYLARFNRLFAQIAPSVVIWELASVNDANAWTSATSGLQRAQALQVIETCLAAGVPVVLSTPMPGIIGSDMSASQQAEVSGLVAFAKGFSSDSGVTALDLTSLHLTPGRWSPIYNDGDGFHPNQFATDAVIVPAAKLAISKLAAMA